LQSSKSTTTRTISKTVKTVKQQQQLKQIQLIKTAENNNKTATSAKKKTIKINNKNSYNY